MNQLSSDDKTTEKCEKKISPFRRILPQISATFVKNLICIDFGFTFGLPTILIPALTGIRNAHNQNEFLTITAEEATWIGSISYLTQMLGCLLSILMTDPLGRKKSMILVNIPFAIGWIMIYQGDAFWKILTGIASLGLGVGLAESSVYLYLGEISEASIRGILIGVSNMTVTIGIFVLFLLNNLMPWRSVALVCMTVPIISAIAICFIPETPQWLIAKNRSAEAEKSLRWLRGWVPSGLVREEFNELQRLGERSKSCVTCIKQEVKCGHPLPTMREKCAELKRKQTIKPFIIVIVMFFISHFSGMLPMRPFLVQIFKAYDSPLPVDQTATIMSISENLSSVIFIFLILPLIGKRRLYLYTMSMVVVCSAIISCYGFIYLPLGYVSFDQETFQLENRYLSYIPLICFLLWILFAFCGSLAMPFMLLSEIFPFKSRGIASALTVTINYIFGFVNNKTYFAMETTLSLPGMSLLYCIVCCFALIFAYLVMPETEGRTLGEIELHFSDNSKKLTNHKIAKSKRGGKKQDDVEHAINDSMKKLEECNGNLKPANGLNNDGFEPELSLEVECSKL